MTYHFWPSQSRGTCGARPHIPAAAWVLVLSAAALSVGACNRGPKPEDAVRAAIAEVKVAAEAGDRAALALRVAEDFEGRDGLDREAVLKLVDRRMRRHRKRYVYIKVRSIEMQDDDQSAVLVALAGLAGGPVAEDARPVEVGANLLKFRLKLRLLDAHWQVWRADWGRANPLELL